MHKKIPPRIAWRELVAVAPGFEPGVACTTQHFECCTFGRSDTLPRLLNLPEITANTQTLLTQPHSHKSARPKPDTQAVTTARTTSAPKSSHPTSGAGRKSPLAAPVPGADATPSAPPSGAWHAHHAPSHAASRKPRFLAPRQQTLLASGEPKA